MKIENDAQLVEAMCQVHVLEENIQDYQDLLDELHKAISDYETREMTVDEMKQARFDYAKASATINPQD